MKRKGPPSFEEQLSRLEEIVEILGAGNESLENSLTLYEEGLKISRNLAEYLKQAQLKIQKLEQDASGQISLQDFPIDNDE